jgi:glycine cleavage system H protein
VAEFLETTVDKFVFRVATDRLYSAAGVWVLGPAADGRLRVGVTDYVQQRSGDVAFVHLPATGSRLEAGKELAELETIKATLSLATPVAGEIAATNADLDPNPEQVNQDPYGKGWLAVLEPADWECDRHGLLDPQGYLVAMPEQAEKELNASCQRAVQDRVVGAHGHRLALRPVGRVLFAEVRLRGGLLT